MTITTAKTRTKNAIASASKKAPKKLMDEVEDKLEAGRVCLSAVTARVCVGWRKLRELSAVLCWQKGSVKMEGKIYKILMRMVIIYGGKTWSMRRLCFCADGCGKVGLSRMRVGVTKNIRPYNCATSSLQKDVDRTKNIRSEI